MQKPEQGWCFDDVKAVYTQPMNDLLFTAQTIHRAHHNPNKLQLSTLLSIKTGACPEDCGYCSQSGHYKTDLEKEQLLSVDKILAKAQEAKEKGSTRFCMGAAWRNPPAKAMPALQEVIKAVKEMGMETCMTLGMLSSEQAGALKEAGLDYYNHNIDTSPSYYEKVVSTRTFADRLETLEHVRQAGISVCCGGILGLGETQADRIEFVMTLANMPTPPESVPINRLMPMKGTPMENNEQVEGLEVVRTIATTRIFIPEAKIRLTAGRPEMSDELQALCFFAGANSVFIGEKYLTGKNVAFEQDQQLFAKLGLEPEGA